jgi:hypothetical protein
MHRREMRPCLMSARTLWQEDTHKGVGWHQEGHLAVKFCTRITIEHGDCDHNGVIAAGRVRCWADLSVSIARYN